MTEQERAMHQRVCQVKDTLAVDVCSLYRADPALETVTMLASCGLEKAIGSCFSYQQGLTGKVARTRRPVAARDIQTHAEYFHIDDSGEERYTSYLGIPLERRGELVGVLVVQTINSKTFFHKDIRELYSAAQDLMNTLTHAEHQKMAS
ncbi:MAG: GAF domain-containing protein [Alcanivoracaceae bacterium]